MVGLGSASDAADSRPAYHFQLLSIIIFLLIRFHSLAFSTSIQSVHLSRDQFNPSIGQSVEISFTLACRGKVDVDVIDRDGHLISKLLTDYVIEGEQKLKWLGRDNDGNVVPDEAYSFRIYQVCGNEKSIYFPATQPAKEMQVEFGYYDPMTGLLQYKLPQPARVHIQSGIAQIDAVTKMPRGPVMKTITNREPRLSGKIVEKWNGYADGESEIYIPHLQDFQISILATSLPENSVITFGNRKKNYLQWTIERSSTKFLPKQADHTHHQGLDAINDVSPKMSLSVGNGIWNEKGRLWEINAGESAEINGALEGLTAKTFAKQPGFLEIFIDERSSKKIESPADPFAFQIPASHLSSGTRIVTVNWSSEYGPTSVSTMRIKINEHSRASDKR